MDKFERIFLKWNTDDQIDRFYRKIPNIQFIMISDNGCCYRFDARCIKQEENNRHPTLLDPESSKHGHAEKDKNFKSICCNKLNIFEDVRNTLDRRIQQTKEQAEK